MQERTEQPGRLNPRENETLEELGKGIKVLQKTDGFRFGSDAVALAKYVSLRKGDYVVELCAGSGVISLLLSAVEPTARFTAVELQTDLADMAQRSVEMNGLTKRISVLARDFRLLSSDIQSGAADVVVANPPYRLPHACLQSDHKGKNASRCELNGTIFDLCTASARILRFGGRFYVVYRPSRLCDLFEAMRLAGIEPKRMAAVYTGYAGQAELVLVEGRRGGNPEMRVEPPVYLLPLPRQDGSIDDVQKKGGTS